MYTVDYMYFFGGGGSPPAAVVPRDTLHSIGIAEMVQSLQAAIVATAAGVAAGTWASSVSPRVYASSKGGYLFGLHRGRLPLVEIAHLGDDPEHTTFDGSWITSKWLLRVHVGGNDLATAEQQAYGITYASLASIRRNLRQKWGSENIGQVTPGTLGHVQETRFSVINTMSRSTFSIVPAALLLETGGRLLLEDGGAMLQEDTQNPLVLTP